MAGQVAGQVVIHTSQLGGEERRARTTYTPLAAILRSNSSPAGNTGPSGRLPRVGGGLPGKEGGAVAPLADTHQGVHVVGKGLWEV